jgi:diguanylate cyclase (GGDEF)-like protein
VEQAITEILNDPAALKNPAGQALAALWERYQHQLAQLEKVSAISDGYQSVLLEQNQTLEERYARQIRQLRKIVRISDHYQQMLRDVNLTLKLASTQDPLTNLSNRRLMMDRMTAELASAERLNRPLSLFLVDIDHFKKINDTLGHDAGDRVLIEIARTLAKELRAYDVCARWGGEEFMVLLPETPGNGALRVAERLCRNVQHIEFMGLPPDIRISVSVGVAEYERGSSVAALIKRADIALYGAKRAGRNTAVLNSDVAYSSDPDFARSDAPLSRA